MTDITWSFTVEEIVGILGHQMEVGPLIGSGVLNYNVPVVSARAEPGGEAYSTAIGSFSKYTTTVHPNTGETIKGWKWDKRTWSDEYNENSAMFVPANWDPTTSGITQSYFQSGIGSNRDLELESIQLAPSSGINERGVSHVWAPEINHGYYYDYEDEGYLFSDDSESKIFTYSGIVSGVSPTEATGFNEVLVSGIPKIGIPIKITQMSWDNDVGKYETTSSLRKKIYFSGERDDDGARVSTYDNNKEAILYNNIDRDEEEFIVTFSGDFPKIILNSQYVEEVGTGVSVSGLEFLGYSQGGADQQYHLEYSPVDNTMGIEVYSYIVSSGTITQWTPIAEEITPSGYQVQVDYDLGILTFGDPEVSGQFAPSAGYSIGARYWKSYKVEYEPEFTSNTLLATEANTNPIYRRSGRGFVYLATQEEDPTSIELTAQLPEISLNAFGPFNIGNAYTPVIATVKDYKGDLLEGKTVEFFITSDPVAGGFGDSDSTSSSTDYKGEARAYYSPPRTIDEIGEEVVASGWSSDPVAGTTTLRTESLFIQGDYNDVFLYETHVDDALMGFLDTTMDQDDIEAQISGYYAQFFQDNEIYGPTGLVTASGLDATTTAIEWEANHRLTWNLARPSIFQPNAGMGRRKLVSVVDSGMLNPYTFTYGAVGPVQPIEIDDVGGGEYDVTFNGAIPKPTGTDFPTASGTLYSYFLVAPTTVTMQASVFNNRLNQNILSNEISIQLQIPPYLSGLWILDSINQYEIDEISSLLSSITASGQMVPLGFRLRSSNVTLASALGGVTFLDLNNPYNYDPYAPDDDALDPPGSGLYGVYLGHKMRVFP